VHRVGRAGHGGGKAQSVTFVAGLDADRWKRIGDFAGVDIPARTAPDLAEFGVQNKGRRTATASTSPERGARSSRATHGSRRPAATGRTKDGAAQPATDPRPSNQRGDRPSWSSKGPRGPQKPRRSGKVDRISRMASSKKLRGLMRKQPLMPDQKPGGGVRRPKA